MHATTLSPTCAMLVAFGGLRTDLSSITQTNLGYTGQRALDSGMGGLMDYKARFYSPLLGRFIQPDSLIPDASNPQAWNRYSYVLGNPISFNDPTGHCADPASATACMALAPAGPIGWVIIGVLLLIDVARIATVVTDIDQTHTAPMTTSDGGVTHSAPMTTDEGKMVVLQAAETEAQILKGIRSLQKQIAKHEAYIEQYSKDPDSLDNKGLLANAQNDTIKEMIIQHRIYNKQKEIVKFQNEIKKLTNQLNDLHIHSK